MPEPTNPNDLLDAIQRNTRWFVRWTRKRFLWTWALGGIVALLTGIAVYVSVHTANRVVMVSTASAQGPSIVKSVTAHCPRGAVLLSGGFDWSPPTSRIDDIASQPASNTGWRVEAGSRLPIGTVWQLTVFVTCLLPPV